MAYCSIIIPYFQKDKEILTRCLDSIFEQEFQDFEIIIVDDSAPLPAQGVISSLSSEQQNNIRVIVQKNQGPGAARNTGLDNVSKDSVMVAFIDSDDVWKPCHLKNAYYAFSKLGADAFSSATEVSEMEPDTLNFTEGNSLELVRCDNEECFYALQFPSQSLRNDWWKYFHLSSLVFRRNIAMDIRFLKEFKYASEDLMFFFSLFQKLEKCIVCTEIGYVVMAGDNFYRGTKWGSDKYIKQHATSIKAHIILINSGQYTKKSNLRDIKDGLESKRDKLFYSLKAYIQDREERTLSTLFFVLCKDPYFIIFICNKLFKKLKKKSK